MIDWDKSAEHNKMSVDELKAWLERYLHSNKKVWAICDDCGKERWLVYAYYYNRCRSCSRVSKNPTEDISNKSIDWIKTKKETGHDMEFFEIRPGSCKKVYRICKGGCGRGDRWVSYSSYHDLCNSCERKKRYKNPEARNKQSKSAIGHEVTEKTRKKLRKAAIKQFEDPEQRRIRRDMKKGKMMGENNPSKKRGVGKKISDAKMGHTVSEQTRRKTSATKQGILLEDWQGYAEDNPYCEKFNESCRKRNRLKYGNRCFICGKPHSENTTKAGDLKRLSVHHVDMNKEQGCNDHDWNLIPLCLAHHGSSHTPIWTARIEYLLNHVWIDSYKW